ncbi:MAG: cytochrome c [Gammaproteobacteria bacterium]
MRFNLLPTLVFLLIALGFGVGPCVAARDAKRGEYLLYAGGCISCHTPKKSGPEGFMAGGRALVTPFGTFYPPNITPDKDTGIGGWSDEDFIRALGEGVSPQGDHYYPAFPYTAYTGITRQDMLDLKAYLFSLPPIHKPNRPHELSWYVSFRFPLAFWKWLNFTPGEFQPDPKQAPEWNRGAYLVRHLGHCGECHTPRSWTGALDTDAYLAGNPDGPDEGKVPNITPDEKTGIGDWSKSDITTVLENGMLPDGDFVGSVMSEVIDDNTSHLAPQDRDAIAVYLKSVPPLPASE